MADLSKLVADLSALTVREAAELAGLLKQRWKGATWTYDEIDREWLAGAKIAAPPNEVIASFERCQRMLGRDWMESTRSSGAWRVTGAFPVLHITSLLRPGQNSLLLLMLPVLSH
jgi:hypothetical protein